MATTHNSPTLPVMVPQVLQELSTSTVAVGLIIATLLIPTLMYPKSILRSLQRMRLQYEVTFALYMMTPMERFVLNSLVFLTLSMIFIAASLYLPEHLLKITQRAFYYWSGAPPSSAAATVGSNTEHVKAAAAQSIAQVKSTILKAAAAVTEAAKE